MIASKFKHCGRLIDVMPFLNCKEQYLPILAKSILGHPPINYML